MLKLYNCGFCSLNCSLMAEIEDTNVLSLTGNRCAGGLVYIKQELANSLAHVELTSSPQGGVQQRKKIDW